MEFIHNGTHFYYGCRVHRAGTEIRNLLNKFWWLHKAFSVTCQMVFCRLRVVGVMSAVVKTTSPPKKFRLVGGDVCLDFTNTVGGKRGATTREYLNSYTDFVSWCQQADLLNESTADALLRSVARHPDESAAALQRAIGL